MNIILCYGVRKNNILLFLQNVSANMNVDGTCDSNSEAESEELFPIIDIRPTQERTMTSHDDSDCIIIADSDDEAPTLIKNEDIKTSTSCDVSVTQVATQNYVHVVEDDDDDVVDINSGDSDVEMLEASPKISPATKTQPTTSSCSTPTDRTCNRNNIRNSKSSSATDHKQPPDRKTNFEARELIARWSAEKETERRETSSPKTPNVPPAVAINTRVTPIQTERKQVKPTTAQESVATSSISRPDRTQPPRTVVTVSSTKQQEVTLHSATAQPTAKAIPSRRSTSTRTSIDSMTSSTAELMCQNVDEFEKSQLHQQDVEKEEERKLKGDKESPRDATASVSTACGDVANMSDFGSEPLFSDDDDDFANVDVTSAIDAATATTQDSARDTQPSQSLISPRKKMAAAPAKNPTSANSIDPTPRRDNDVCKKL